MSDATSRATERNVACGDFAAEVANLKARLDRGELTRGRIELAAYCGDKRALEVLGECPACCESSPITEHGFSYEELKREGYGARCIACGRWRPWPRRSCQYLLWIFGLVRLSDAGDPKVVSRACESVPIEPVFYMKDFISRALQRVRTGDLKGIDARTHDMVCALQGFLGPWSLGE